MRKTTIAIALMLAVSTCFAQTVTVNPYYTTSKENFLGAEVHLKFPSRIVVGVGTSFALKTYNGSSKVYEESIHSIQDYPLNSKDVLSGSPFVYHTKLVKAAVGYSLGNTSILLDLGIVWRTQYWKCNAFKSGGYVPLPNSNPNGNYFTYRSLKNVGLYGVTVTQPIKGRVGAILGYNSIEKFRFGLSWRVTPDYIFRW